MNFPFFRKGLKKLFFRGKMNFRKNILTSQGPCANFFSVQKTRRKTGKKRKGKEMSTTNADTKFTVVKTRPFNGATAVEYWGYRSSHARRKKSGQVGFYPGSAGAIIFGNEDASQKIAAKKGATVWTLKLSTESGGELKKI